MVMEIISIIGYRLIGEISRKIKDLWLAVGGEVVF